MRMLLLGVPLFTLAHFRGMALAHEELRKLGVANSLLRGGSVLDLGELPLPGPQKDRGPSRLKNLPHFIRGTEVLGDFCSKFQGAGLTVLLGGECSLVLGSLLGLKKRLGGKTGLVWMDAHGDFTPETTPSGYIGGMCLAFSCGRGPRLSRSIEDLRPLIAEDTLVHLGSRALEGLEEKSMMESEMELLGASQMRRDGGAQALRAAKRLADRSDQLVLHVDLDVIDPEEIPAVNFPTPGGISLHYVSTLGRTLLRTEKLKAIEVASYNPERDPEHVSGKRVIELLSHIFR